MDVVPILLLIVLLLFLYYFLMVKNSASSSGFSSAGSTAAESAASDNPGNQASADNREALPGAPGGTPLTSSRAPGIGGKSEYLVPVQPVFGELSKDSIYAPPPTLNKREGKKEKESKGSESKKLKKA